MTLDHEVEKYDLVSYVNNLNPGFHKILLNTQIYTRFLADKIHSVDGVLTFWSMRGALSVYPCSFLDKKTIILTNNVEQFIHDVQFNEAFEEAMT